jgi:hypothetical protein
MIMKVGSVEVVMREGFFSFNRMTEMTFAACQSPLYKMRMANIAYIWKIIFKLVTNT